MINGSIDSVLRGTGVWGSAVATLKNMAIKYVLILFLKNVAPPVAIAILSPICVGKNPNSNNFFIAA